MCLNSRKEFVWVVEAVQIKLRLQGYCKEAKDMGRRSQTDVAWTEVDLEHNDTSCSVCGRRMHVKKHRRRRVFTLGGAVCFVVKLMHCPDVNCSNHHRLFGPKIELTLAMPQWLIAWDVFCWLGHRRFARHWSVPQLRSELLDSYGIVLSEDAIEDYLQRYQCMLAARQQDFALLKSEYAATRHVVLSIDGLQPEKGHETLYVVRELGKKRVWFAMPLLSSAASEIRPLIKQAKDWSERLGCRIRLWMSDKQEAFVKTISSGCPGVQHRYCSNHFLRDLAKPMLDVDSHAKVQMRRNIRGLRAIERIVLTKRAAKATSLGDDHKQIATAVVLAKSRLDVVMDYCAAVRGILNDSQGGPLRPPSLRMSEALRDVRKSLERNIGLKKGGFQNHSWNNW
jgi:hypothetical protein